MERTPVSSSNLVSVGYDPDSSILEVEFNNARIYQYYDVPDHIYSELMGAESLGSYLHHNVKPFFGCSMI
ncbi:KTSC domain-containing protein [Marinimicrobium locisalis]|uniref:KTSC domain-containing protein n=1 Tax=Marinimicrobium locisalis TaxID=546022 RepID=UPI00322184FC